jgi:hypothetical protein
MSIMYRNPRVDCSSRSPKAGREVELSIDWQPTWRGNEAGGLRQKSRAVALRDCGFRAGESLSRRLRNSKIIWISTSTTLTARPTRHCEVISCGGRTNELTCPRCYSLDCCSGQPGPQHADIFLSAKLARGTMLPLLRRSRRPTMFLK